MMLRCHCCSLPIHTCLRRCYVTGLCWMFIPNFRQTLYNGSFWDRLGILIQNLLDHHMSLGLTFWIKNSKNRKGSKSPSHMSFDTFWQMGVKGDFCRLKVTPNGTNTFRSESVSHLLCSFVSEGGRGKSWSRGECGRSYRDFNEMFHLMPDS